VRELDGIFGKRRPRVAVIALQDDKPMEAMLAALAPALDSLVATTSGHTGHARGVPAQTLSDAARTAAFPHVTAEPEPFIALSRARERAGDGGAVLVTGSLYLLERLRAAALEAR
jgi:folylpolyglutamate synthase/dihydropteroate synthase